MFQEAGACRRMRRHKPIPPDEVVNNSCMAPPAAGAGRIVQGRPHGLVRRLIGPGDRAREAARIQKRLGVIEILLGDPESFRYHVLPPMLVPLAPSWRSLTPALCGGKVVRLSGETRASIVALPNLRCSRGRELPGRKTAGALLAPGWTHSLLATGIAVWLPPGRSRSRSLAEGRRRSPRRPSVPRELGMPIRRYPIPCLRRSFGICQGGLLGCLIFRIR